MARTLLLFVALVLALPARAEDTPMVWAFQHFCADETFTLDEARLAIAVAGGKQRGPTASTNFPNPMSITFWDIMIDGHKIGISLGSTRAQAAAGGAADLVSCAVYADGSDETGAAQLQKWAGVAPIPMPGGGAETYRFISDGGRHIPISNDAGSADGRAWQVIVTNGSFANVTLMRFLKMRESR
jgi:hypothetical protein